MSLHDIALEILCRKLGGMNNHSHPVYKIGGFIPDIVVLDEKGKPKELHEVEIVHVRSLPSDTKIKRVLWCAFACGGWDEINALYFEAETETLLAFKKVLSETEFLKRWVTDLEEVNSILRSRKSKLRDENVIKLLYQMPLVEFKKDMNPELCLICGEPSAITIDASDRIGKYGLCKKHFKTIVEIEEV